jgi:hypothetical protein
MTYDDYGDKQTGKIGIKLLRPGRRSEEFEAFKVIFGVCIFGV